MTVRQNLESVHLIVLDPKDYCKAPRGRLTTRCYGYIIGDKSDEGQDAPSRVEMGNVGNGQ